MATVRQLWLEQFFPPKEISWYFNRQLAVSSSCMVVNHACILAMITVAPFTSPPLRILAESCFVSSNVATLLCMETLVRVTIAQTTFAAATEARPTTAPAAPSVTLHRLTMPLMLAANLIALTLTVVLCALYDTYLYQLVSQFIIALSLSYLAVMLVVSLLSLRAQLVSIAHAHAQGPVPLRVHNETSLDQFTRFVVVLTALLLFFIGNIGVGIASYLDPPDPARYPFFSWRFGVNAFAPVYLVAHVALAHRSWRTVDSARALEAVVVTSLEERRASIMRSSRPDNDHVPVIMLLPGQIN